MQPMAPTSMHANGSGARKPWPPASMTPQVKPPIPAIASTWLGMSNGTGRVGDVGKCRAIKRTTAQTGTLIAKTQPQWMGTRRPPSRGPHAVAAEPPMPQMASARERARSVRYASLMSDMDEGRVRAPAMPSATRPKTSIGTLFASAQMSDATAKPATPAMNTRLAPRRSEMLPAHSRSMASGIV